jgi:hypothetical protein
MRLADSDSIIRWGCLQAKIRSGGAVFFFLQPTAQTLSTKKAENKSGRGRYFFGLYLSSIRTALPSFSLLLLFRFLASVAGCCRGPGPVLTSSEEAQSCVCDQVIASVPPSRCPIPSAHAQAQQRSTPTFPPNLQQLSHRTSTQQPSFPTSPPSSAAFLSFHFNRSPPVFFTPALVFSSTNRSFLLQHAQINAHHPEIASPAVADADSIALDGDGIVPTHVGRSLHDSNRSLRRGPPLLWRTDRRRTRP